MNKDHGSPYDRGGADSYYRRGRDPHWWPEGTGFGTRVERENMTLKEIAEYDFGYLENEEGGHFKDYG
jgi:hypothetical protein